MMNSQRLNRLFAAGTMVALTACALDPDIPVRTDGFPPGWSGSTATGQYEIGVDSGARNGIAAAFLLSVTPNPTFATMHQRIRADDYAGKRVRLSAWVKHRTVQSGGLWMRVDGYTHIFAFDNMSPVDRRIQENSDWHQISVVLDVHPAAVGIALGVLLSGRGEVVVDDMVLEVVGTDVPVTNLMAEPTPTSDSAGVAAAYGSAPLAPVNLNFEDALQRRMR